MKNLKSLSELHGLVAPLTSPSGRKFVIRQQNGNDDDIISNAEDTANGTAMVKFLSSIIVDSDLTSTSYDELLKLRLSDIYYLMLASRIFSLGKILRFQYQWDLNEEPVDYEEDLENFIWDYENKFPEKGEEHYNPFRIKPISKDLVRTFTLTSGKVVSYSYMNIIGETFLLKLKPSEKSKNKELLARKLCLITDGVPVQVENFRFFSAMDMLEIRKDIIENDPSPEVYSEIKHPFDDKVRILYPIMATMDFFFPREIL